MTKANPDNRHVKLTLRQRLALQHGVELKPTAETAKEFGVSPAAIRMRRHRALKRLTTEQAENYRRAVSPGRKFKVMPISFKKGGV